MFKFAPYSKSRLDASDCPWAFANIYIKEDLQRNGFDKKYEKKKYGDLRYELFDYNPEKKAINLLFGESAHLVLEELIKQKQLGTQLTVEFVTDILNRLVPNEIIHGPTGFDYPSIQKIVTRFLNTYDYNHDYISGIEVPLGIKFGGEHCDYNDPECFLRMRADVLEIDVNEGLARLTDHKTQMHIEDASENFQLALYSYIIFSNYKLVDKINARLNFCRYGRYEGADYYRNDTKLVEAAIVAKVQAIETRKDFTEAKRCGFCDVCKFQYNGCPMLKREQRDDVPTPVTREDAIRMFEDLISVEAKREAMKMKIQEWCARNATVLSVPVPVDSPDLKDKISNVLCIGFRDTESTDYDYGKITELMKSYNISPDRYLLTNKKELDRIVNTKKAVKELFPDDAIKQESFKSAVEAAMIKTPGVRFERFKVNPIKGVKE